MKIIRVYDIEKKIKDSPILYRIEYLGKVDCEGKKEGEEIEFTVEMDPIGNKRVFVSKLGNIDSSLKSEAESMILQMDKEGLLEK